MIEHPIKDIEELHHRAGQMEVEVQVDPQQEGQHHQGQEHLAASHQNLKEVLGKEVEQCFPDPGQLQGFLPFDDDRDALRGEDQNRENSDHDQQHC